MFSLNAKLYKRAFTYLVLVLFSFWTSASRADCGACAGERSELAKKTADRDRILNIKRLNEDYLKSHPNASNSIQVKAKSNVLLAGVKAETALNEITFLTDKIGKECGGCP